MRTGLAHQLLTALAVGCVVAIVGVNAGVYNNISVADILHAFDRPTEPVFSLRGLQRDAVFEMPPQYLPSRYRESHWRAAELARDGLIRGIPLRPVEVRRDLEATLSTLPFRGKYSFAVGAHAGVMLRFYLWFIDIPSLDDFLSAVVWSRCHFNPEMVLDATRMAILNRPDTQELQLPELTLYQPELFVDEVFFAKAREEMMMVPNPYKRVAIPVVRNGTSCGDDEDALWFFREDPGLNLFHWHWHISHPGAGDKRAIDLDRRGELFTYFHRQILARYNANRFCLNMKPLQSLKLREPIREGYVPKLAMLHGSRSFPGRQPNTTLKDIVLENLNASRNISEVEAWVAAVKKAIARGWATDKFGNRVPLESVHGLDILADALEGVPSLSPDYDLYGSLHNTLHRMVGFVHDPEQSFQEPMGTLATLNIIRDPAFYRIHGFMDDLYEEFKSSFKPYERSDLEFPDVQVSGVQVQSAGQASRNELKTFYLETDLDVSMGIDFTPPGQMFARFTRLVHQPFRYNIQVRNSGNETKDAFVRIFMLLQRDEMGSPLKMQAVQRWSMEMDKFKATIKPGKSEITRRSVETSVSIDPDRVYEVARTRREVRAVNHCRCGFPMSLMVPRGTPEGYKVTLFAMLTDYQKEGVDPSADEICREGWSLCGAPGSKLYPDRRPMGFPFDRRFPDTVRSLDDFLTKNMAVQDVVIKFEDRVLSPSSLLSSGRSTSWRVPEEDYHSAM